MLDMSAYLTSKAADYTAEVLSVTPQNVITEEGAKNQIEYEMDDGTVYVVTLSASYFLVTLEWTYLSDAGGDADTIIDFWHNPAKANGKARTFYWRHPKTLKTFTARFTGPVRREISGRKPRGSAILKVTLRVEGNKPA